ncbi:MAG: hypothetical protein HY273_15180 [Gammaproteobacteria bacterium]|nr:hypothetical protein [Gammaproteobacteria bacterium]
MKLKLDKQLNRLFISAKDMDKCQLFFAAAEKAVSAEDWDAVEGLITAGIVAYARPFSGNGNHTRATPHPPFSQSSLSETEMELHKNLLSLRNSVIAHSKAEMNPTRVMEYGETGFLIRNQIYDAAMEHSRLKEFLDLAKKVRGVFESKMLEISSMVSKLEQ